MTMGMDKSQFLKFRMALLPSSGFQSVQYRMLEIRSTNLSQLCHNIPKVRTIEKLYKNLYWKSGANELKTGQKTYTLKQFEKKYDERLLKLSNKMVEKNIWIKYQQLDKKDQENKVLKQLLKEYDSQLNINWKLAHFKSAVKYLHQSDKNIAATGGTNWKKYLPPKFQKLIFFPNLWTGQEKDEWGKSWVENINL